MKTNRLPWWAECFFPSGMSRSVFIIEDSIVDPVNRILITYTWNLNHTTLMVRRRRLEMSEHKTRLTLLTFLTHWLCFVSGKAKRYVSVENVRSRNLWGKPFRQLELLYIVMYANVASDWLENVYWQAERVGVSEQREDRRGLLKNVSPWSCLKSSCCGHHVMV